MEGGNEMTQNQDSNFNSRVDWSQKVKSLLCNPTIVKQYDLSSSIHEGMSLSSYPWRIVLPSNQEDGTNDDVQKDIYLSDSYLDLREKQNMIFCNVSCRQGVEYAKQQLYPQAEAQFQKSLAVYPHHIDTLVSYGAICGTMKQYDKGLSLLNQVLENKNENERKNTKAYENARLYKEQIENKLNHEINTPSIIPSKSTTSSAQRHINDAMQERKFLLQEDSTNKIIDVDKEDDSSLTSSRQKKKKRRRKHHSRRYRHSKKSYKRRKRKRRRKKYTSDESSSSSFSSSSSTTSYIPKQRNGKRKTKGSFLGDNDVSSSEINHVNDTNKVAAITDGGKTLNEKEEIQHGLMDKESNKSYQKNYDDKSKDDTENMSLKKKSKNRSHRKKYKHRRRKSYNSLSSSDNNS